MRNWYTLAMEFDGRPGERLSAESQRRVMAAAQEAVDFLNYHNNPPDERDHVSLQIYVSSLGRFFLALQQGRDSKDQGQPGGGIPVPTTEACGQCN